MTELIFCPRCYTLLLEEQQCPKCGWMRPTRPPGQDKRLLWEKRYDEGIYSGLVWGRQTLFFLDGQGGLRALDVNRREEIWERPVDLGRWRIQDQVAVADGRVMVGPTDINPIPEPDKVMLALDVRTGAELWRRPLHERQIFDPLIAGNRIFVSTSSPQAVALDVRTGAELWRRPLPGIYRAAPAAYDDLVIFGGDEGVVIALRQENGEVAWQYRAEPFGSSLESVRYTPAVRDGVVYFTCWNRKTYALNGATGQVIWISQPTKKRPPITAPAVGEDILFFAARDRYIYALDRATGEERWRTQLPKHSEVKPVLVGDMLVVAALDHHVYALDANTGEVQEAPLLTTGGRVTKSWAFDGDNLYLADNLGKIYAVRLVQPAEEAANPEALIREGKWEDAAVAWALQGNYTRSAKIYAEQLNQPFQAAQLYDKADAADYAARQYELAGDMKRALERYRQARVWDKVAALSKQMGDLLAAAQAHEALGQMEQAAQCYYDLKKYNQAVLMMEQAAVRARSQGQDAQVRAYLDWLVDYYTEKSQPAQPAKAVALLNQFGRKEEARKLLQSISGWKDEPGLVRIFRNVVTSPQERARAYEKEGAWVLAAQEYKEAKDHARAAAMYVRAHEITLAAEEYNLANLPAKAADMMVRLENWDEAAELYLAAERLQDALNAFLRAGDYRHAAGLHERLGQWDKAAEHWESLGLWQHAAKAWEKAGALERAARAWIKEGDAMRAADNYEKAAHQQALTDPHDVEAMARLYELAMEQYRDYGVANKAEFCDQRRRYYRGQPLIQVNAITMPGEENLVINEWGKLDVIISNQGWGQARDIRIQVAAQHFELDAARLQKSVGLVMRGRMRYTLWLKPRDAGAVPLHLSLFYLDRRGKVMPELTYDADIKVLHSDSKTTTPQVVHVQGDYIQAEQVAKQVGDRVDVKRGDGERNVSLNSDDPATRHSPPATRHSQPATRPPTIECAYCGTPQPATNSRCENPRCGEPFIRCPDPTCGLYQPKNEREPEQFCLFCGGRM